MRIPCIIRGNQIHLKMTNQSRGFPPRSIFFNSTSQYLGNTTRHVTVYYNRILLLVELDEKLLGIYFLWMCIEIFLLEFISKSFPEQWVQPSTGKEEEEEM